MADNVNYTEPAAGTGVVPIAADEISSAKYQRIKLVHGADGVNAGDVATGNPLPVVQTGTPALPTGAATAARQDTGNTSLSSIDGKTPALGQALAAASVPVILPAATITTLTPPAAITGFATAAKQPALGTAGTASADVLTVQGIASMTALKTDGSAVTQPVSASSLPLPAGAATSANQSTGNSSLATIATDTTSLAAAKTTISATNLLRVAIFDDAGAQVTSFGGAGGGATANTEYAEDTASIAAEKVILAGVVRSDTAATRVDTDGDRTTLIVDASGRLHTTVGNTVAVSGTFWQATQPVSNAGTFAVQVSSALPAGTNAIGKLAANSGVDIGDVDVTSCALPTGAATSAKQPALGTAGTASSDVLTVQGIASMTALKVDGSAVTQPVSGTFWQATQPVSAASLPLPSGAATAAKQPALGTAGTAASDVITVQGITSMTALKVDGSAVTQPVSLASVPSHAVTNAGTFAVQVSAAIPAGTNNIGDVDVLTLPATPAGTNLIGKVSSGLDTSTINNGTTALTPKFAAISASSSGNSTVVAAVTSKKIRVLSYRFQAAADVDVKFRDNTAAADLTGAMSTGAKGGGGGAAFSPVGHFETASGNALSINLSSAVQVSGHLCYLEI